MKTRQVQPTAFWINAHESPPPNGSRVLGLTRGSKLIEMVFTSKSTQSIDAWCHYPAIPDDIRALQAERWTPEEFKGETND